ncbi:MAG: arylsulfotransferase family protein [Paracoccaceae bacterium]
MRDAVNEVKIGFQDFFATPEAFAYQKPVVPVEIARALQPDAVSPGMTLVYGAGEELAMVAKIVDQDGNTVHLWDIDMFDVWSDMDHVPKDRRPKSRPGGEIAGLVFLPDGDIVFNLEPVGLMRMDYCGVIRWQLPYLTHHSVQLGGKGNFFASGQTFSYEPDSDWPALGPFFIEDTIVEVTPNGEIMDEISILDVLRQNGLEGQIYSGVKSSFGVELKGDILHLNDVEPFPTSLTEGVFRQGDLMVSMRNLNSVMVFEQATKKL